jgi:DNA-binding CsgD family transcriptional regulator
MDRVPFALLVVDGNHHPIYRNAGARRLLDEQLLDIDPAGRLRSRCRGERLAPLIDRALDPRRSTQPGAALLEDGASRRLHAWAAALGDQPDSMDECLVALIVFDSGLDRAYTWEALRTLYGLTPKEAAMVNALLQGQSLEDYCAASFVTSNTARTHLKSVYRKTGTNRQAELVRLFASMFMPLEAE